MAFSDQTLFHYSLLSLLLASPLSFLSLQFLSAPYGKHRRPGWGPTLYPPVAWFVMEGPTLWLSLLLFPLGQNRLNPKALSLYSPFLIHYLHRTIIYPLRLHLQNHRQKIKSLKTTDPKTASGFPVSVAAMGFFYNIWNTYLQARWISHYADYETDNGWFWWRFCVGMAVFVSGMAVNVWADLVLMGLKGKAGNYNYSLPRGGLFNFVSCPNYLGEVVEWLGWAVMTWSWVGVGFFLFTFSNLVPRAHSHRKWYLEKFGEDYPKNRKAVIPFLY